MRPDPESVAQSRRLTGGSREDGTNDLTELLKSIGEYAAVETWLMQAIVWANYYLEKGGEEEWLGVGAGGEVRSTPFW